MKRLLGLLLCAAASACSSPGTGATAYTGASIFDGTTVHPNATLVVRNGRVEAITSAVPTGATVVDLAGRYVIPGLVNSHGHVSDVRGLERGHYTTDNLERQLRLYARYGITTVVSLGGDGPEAVTLRDAQASDPTLNRARVFVAGAVVTGDTPEAVSAVVDDNVEMGADFIKIRIDDNLGTISKMPPEVYQAVIDRAAEHGKRVTSHLFYLDDAKELLQRGTGFIAHSIRDRDVDAEFLEAIRATEVCYSPTLMREVSTFVYESEPEFFSDPFFLDAIDESLLDQLRTPERRARSQRAADAYKPALEIAMRNVEALHNAGVRISMGTDTGPEARFQGYFEHMELELMQDAGLSPVDVLRSATVHAAQCLDLDGVGTLEPGAWADFVVLTEDPTIDVSNTRSIESVWVRGNAVER